MRIYVDKDNGSWGMADNIVTREATQTELDALDGAPDSDIIAFGTASPETPVCNEDGDCGAEIQASMGTYWSLTDEGWVLEGFVDDDVHIYCGDDHSLSDDPRFRDLREALSAACEAMKPGTTWDGSDPAHRV